MLPKNLTVPVTVIFVGVILLLGNMGIIPNEIVAFWPVILVVGGLIGLTTMDIGNTPLKKTKSSPVKKSTIKKKTTKSRK